MDEVIIDGHTYRAVVVNGVRVVCEVLPPSVGVSTLEETVRKRGAHKRYHVGGGKPVFRPGERGFYAEPEEKD